MPWNDTGVDFKLNFIYLFIFPLLLDGIRRPMPRLKS